MFSVILAFSCLRSKSMLLGLHWRASGPLWSVAWGLRPLLRAPVTFLGALPGILDCLALAPKATLVESWAIQSSLSVPQAPFGDPQIDVFEGKSSFFVRIWANQFEVQGGSRPREARPKILVYIYIYVCVYIYIYIYIFMICD